MQQLTIFDYALEEPVIKKIEGPAFSYEVGRDGVAKIEITNHGSDDLIIYEVSNASDELIVFAGLLKPHDVEWSK